jgi:hypothetical protein
VSEVQGEQEPAIREISEHIKRLRESSAQKREALSRVRFNRYAKDLKREDESLMREIACDEEAAAILEERLSVLRGQ